MLGLVGVAQRGPASEISMLRPRWGRLSTPTVYPNEAQHQYPNEALRLSRFLPDGTPASNAGPRSTKKSGRG